MSSGDVDLDSLDLGRVTQSSTETPVVHTRPGLYVDLSVGPERVFKLYTDGPVHMLFFVFGASLKYR